MAAVITMDAKELRQIAEELAKLDCPDNPIFELRLAIGKIVSFMQSEQRTVVLLERQVKQHDRFLFGDKEDIENHPGVAQYIANQKRITKMLNAVLLAVVTLIAVEGLKLIAHIK